MRLEIVSESVQFPLQSLFVSKGSYMDFATLLDQTLNSPKTALEKVKNKEIEKNKLAQEVAEKQTRATQVRILEIVFKNNDDLARELKQYFEWHGTSLYMEIPGHNLITVTYYDHVSCQIYVRPNSQYSYWEIGKALLAAELPKKTKTVATVRKNPTDYLPFKIVVMTTLICLTICIPLLPPRTVLCHTIASFLHRL